MNAGIAKTIKLKMYIEGIEMPVSSVSINENINNPPTCDVNIGTNKYASYLLPGSLMQLFYWLDGQYKLIFEGELAGLSYAKTTSNQQVSLRFVGLTNMLGHAWLNEITFSVSSVKTKPFYLSVSDYSGFGKNPVEADGTIFENPAYNTDSDSSAIDSGAPTRAQSIIMHPENHVNTVLQEMKRIVEEAMSKKEGGENPLQYLFEYVFDEVLQRNNYFNLMNRNLRLKDRLYVFPNAQADELLQAENFYEHIFSAARSAGEMISLRKFMTIMCEYLGYNWVELPAPCLIDGKLKSIIIKPKMDFMLPIVNNVVYPNTYTGFKYSRNFMQEPTRLAAKSSPIWFTVAPGKAPTGFFLAVSPDTSIITSDNEPNTVMQQFNPEEKYKGIYPKEEGQLDYLEQVYLELVNAESLEHLREKWKTRQDYLQNMSGPIEQETSIKDELDLIRGTRFEADMQGIADRRFFELRASARGANTTTVYSPYRMLGFPGAILNDNLPHTVGVFASMSTTISAYGDSTQNITVTSPRSYINEKLDFDLENSPVIRRYYSPKYYPKNIGKVYAPLVNNPVAEINSNDASVYLYARNLTDDQKTGIHAQGAKETDETYIHRLSLSRALNQYNSTKNTAQYQYSQKHTQRTLVSEADYMNFINLADNTNLSSESNARKASELTVANAKTRFGNQPFVVERRERVNLAKIKGTAINAL